MDPEFVRQEQEKKAFHGCDALLGKVWRKPSRLEDLEKRLMGQLLQVKKS